LIAATFRRRHGLEFGRRPTAPNEEEILKECPAEASVVVMRGTIPPWVVRYEFRRVRGTLVCWIPRWRSGCALALLHLEGFAW